MSYLYTGLPYVPSGVDAHTLYSQNPEIRNNFEKLDFLRRERVDGFLKHAFASEGTQQLEYYDRNEALFTWFLGSHFRHDPIELPVVRVTYDCLDPIIQLKKRGWSKHNATADSDLPEFSNFDTIGTLKQPEEYLRLPYSADDSDGEESTIPYKQDLVKACEALRENEVHLFTYIDRDIRTWAKSLLDKAILDGRFPSEDHFRASCAEILGREEDQVPRRVLRASFFSACYRSFRLSSALRYQETLNMVHSEGLQEPQFQWAISKSFDEVESLTVQREE